MKMSLCAYPARRPGRWRARRLLRRIDSTPTTPPSPAPTDRPRPHRCPAPWRPAQPRARPRAATARGRSTTFCDRQVAAYGAEVDAAITLLIQQRPDIFDLNQQAGEGGYKVLKPTEYYAGVIREPRGARASAPATTSSSCR